jgi:hypothetical protein
MPTTFETYDIDIGDLMAFAEAYAELDPNARSAINDVLDRHFDEVSASMIRRLVKSLGGMSSELDEALEAYRPSKDDADCQEDYD